MKSYIKLNQKTYDNLAEEYKSRLNDYKVSDKKLIAPFVEYLKKTFEKVRILELGPGSGLALSLFKKEGFETSGIEVSEKMLEVAKSTSPESRLILGDFLEHDFEDSRFEGIFSKAFLHLFTKEDAIEILSKIKNLLVPNGAFFVSTTLHSKSEEGYFEKSDFDGAPKRFRKRWTEEELVQTLESLNYKVIYKSYNTEKDRNKNWITITAVV